MSLLQALRVNLFGVEGCFPTGSAGFSLSLFHARVLGFSGVCFLAFCSISAP